MVLTEAIQIPFNAFRLWQMLRLVRQTEKAADGDLSLDWLEPFGTERRFKAGEVVFRKGDEASEMFYVKSGRYRVVEPDIEVVATAADGVDAIVMRHSASGAAHQVARWFDETGTRVSVVNAGDGLHEHPTQALLDAYTLERRLGSLEGRHVAIVGDVTHSRVFRSNVLALPRLGAEVTVVAPPTLMPSGVTSWAQAEGFALSDDLDEVIASGVDALMMLRVQRERMSGGFFPTAREYTVGYGLTRDRLAALTAANPEAVICHPGPMNRGLEIAADAADAAAPPSPPPAAEPPAPPANPPAPR